MAVEDTTRKPINTLNSNSDSRGLNVIVTEDIEPNIIEDKGQTTYIGYAPRLIDVTTSSPVWRIKKIESVGQIVSIQYPNGDKNYVYSWDERETYSYR